MKIKLNVHADWERWLSKLLEVSQDYALVLPLWHFAYERLYSEHKICPPLWVKAWVETKMTLDSMTKKELMIWKFVKARLDEDSTQDNVPGEQDENSKAADATTAARAESRRRISELLDAKPSTPVLTFRPRLRTKMPNYFVFQNLMMTIGTASQNMLMKSSLRRVILVGWLELSYSMETAWCTACVLPLQNARAGDRPDQAQGCDHHSAADN